MISFFLVWISRRIYNIIKTIKNDANTLKTLLQKKKTATIEELKSILDTSVNMTIFRKPKKISYITSYSHAGKYYTLPEIPDFDENGIWNNNSVMFSIHGSLQKTAQAFVENSEGGYSARELKKILRVEVKEPLLNLYRLKQLYRKKIQDCYVYFSVLPQIRKNQFLHRNKKKAEFETQMDKLGGKSLSEKIVKSIFLFFTTLNEKQQRLYAGLESLKIGNGGDKKVASMLGMDPHTVARGRSEIQIGIVETNRIRKKGGGRIPVEKKSRK